MDTINSIIYYSRWAEIGERMPDALFIEFHRAIDAYMRKGKEPDATSLIYYAFLMVKQQIDEDKAKWQDVRTKRSEAGQKGNTKRWKDYRKTSQTSQNVANVANVAVNVNDNVNVNNKESTNVPKKGKAVSLSLKQRSESFMETIKPYVEKYGREMCNEFFAYWSEPNAKGQMRFEMQKTWEISRRLSRWNNGKLRP